MLLIRTVTTFDTSEEQFVLTFSKIRKGVLSAPCYNKYLFWHILLMNTHLPSVLVCSADLVDRGPSHSSLHLALPTVLLLGGPGEGLVNLHKKARDALKFCSRPHVSHKLSEDCSHENLCF